jgi:hypothetical protein
MANNFKSTANANIETAGNTIYTCPAATQTTLIGMAVANKGKGTVSANIHLRRSGIDYVLIANVPILSGSTLVPIGGEQKFVLQANDVLRANASTNNSIDIIASLLEIT